MRPNSLESRFIDGLAPYDRWLTLINLDTRLRLYDPDYQAMVDLASRTLPRAGLILDIGCGEGGACAVMAADSAYRRFGALDHSAIALRAIEERFHLLGMGRRLTPMQSNFLTLDILPDSVDGMIMMNSFIYVPVGEKERFMGRLRRGLKPGARLVIIDPIPTNFWDFHAHITTKASLAIENGANFTPWELQLLGALFQLPLDFGEPFICEAPAFCRPDALEAMARKAGFSGVEMTHLPEKNEIHLILTK